MELAIAGGGTGGHLYPGLAVAAAVNKIDPEVKITFYGTKQGIESRVLPELGYDVKYVSAKGFLGKSRAAKLLFPLWMTTGIIQSLFYMIRNRPDVVLGTGGYVSAPSVMAAWMLRVPVVLLALDVMPSKAVRFLTGFADKIYSGFPECARYLNSKAEVIFTGNPIRPEIGKLPKEQGIARYGLDENKKTVLIFGGSQGAHSINISVLDSLKYLDQSGQLKNIQMIFQTGKKDYDQVSEAAGKFQAKITVMAYIDEMSQALATADLVISRSGSSISETLACGLPSILIPYPHAASNHQEYNARSLEKAGAAEMILDRELSGNLLADRIAAILFNEKKIKGMAAAARALAKPEAARIIAENIIRNANN